MKANITISTARELYKQGGAGKAFALDNFTKTELTELPKTWNDFDLLDGYYTWNNEIRHAILPHTNTCVFRTQEQASASIALAQLSQLIYVYNDGWEPNWNNDNHKFTIICHKETHRTDTAIRSRKFLAFKSHKIAEDFLCNFRNLIEQAKPLL